METLLDHGILEEELEGKELSPNYNLHDFLKQPYHSDNPFELSYSQMLTFYECERKFEINRLLQGQGSAAESGDFAYFQRGIAYGAGVQAYLLTGDMDFSLAVCWLSYEPETEDLEKNPTISLARTLNNLFVSKEKLDKIRKRYKVAYFNGRPAIELSFKISIDGRWYFIGHIDLVLYDTEQKIYVVLETKTTAYKISDLRPLYQNSSQGLGYSIVIDQIVGKNENHYGILYLVCRDKNNSDFVPDIEIFPFQKTIVDRLKWFYTLSFDVARLREMYEMGMFPLRGQSCIHFNRTCPHFGFCTLTSGDVKKPEKPDKRKYDFEFNLEDIIKDHVARVRPEEVRIEQTIP